MSFGQFFFQVGDRQALVFEQYEQVVDQVGCLVNHVRIVVRYCLDDGFDRFFAYFLCDLFNAFGEQFRGISRWRCWITLCSSPMNPSFSRPPKQVFVPL